MFHSILALNRRLRPISGHSATLAIIHGMQDKIHTQYGKNVQLISLCDITFRPTMEPGFLTNSDGAGPVAGLTLSDNTLYGTGAGAGNSGSDTVFSLSFAPQLTIIPSTENVILSWPTNVAGFDYMGLILQSTTNLISSVVWSAVSPAPAIVDGQNTVTNPITGTQRFFRLSR